MTTKREMIDFKRGDRLFSPKYGYITIEGTRGHGQSKELMILIEGVKTWLNISEIR